MYYGITLLEKSCMAKDGIDDSTSTIEQLGNRRNRLGMKVGKNFGRITAGMYG